MGCVMSARPRLTLTRLMSVRLIHLALIRVKVTESPWPLHGGYMSVTESPWRFYACSSSWERSPAYNGRICQLVPGLGVSLWCLGERKYRLLSH